MNRQLLLGKKEVTYNVDPTNAAANTLRAEDVTFNLTGERVTPNTAKPGVGGEADHTFGEHAELGFNIPLATTAAAGVVPKWGFILKACGWSEDIEADESVTYALLANPEASDSIAFKWRDGNRRVHLVTGWRGRAGLMLTAGQRPMLKLMGRGIHHDPTTAGAILAHADADFTGWADSKPVANGTTSFAYAGITGLGIWDFSLDSSDNVKFINKPEQIGVFLLGERAFTGQMKVTCPLPSTLNLETKWRTGVQDDWSLIHNVGGTAGQVITLAGRSQLMAPKYSRDNEFDVASADQKLVPSSLTADDDLTIVIA